MPENKYIIMLSGSDPPQYFRTRLLKSVGAGRPCVLIREQRGVWCGSKRMARRYGNKYQPLPEGTKYVTVPAGSGKNGRARQNKRNIQVPF